MPIFDFIGWIVNNQTRFLSLFGQHLQLVIVAVLLATLLAVPLGVIASRVPWLAGPLTWMAGVGQTVPGLAILGLMLPLLGIGFLPSLAALTVRALFPIFLNTYIGIHSADHAVVEAARGMGASNRQQLVLVELPLASPVIFAGVRTATVQIVGLATLAAFIGGGGLGDLILQGILLFDRSVLMAGAVPVALLAMTADWVMGKLSFRVVPVGLRLEPAPAGA
jgi:osmoprotectant transport system permease protein